MAIKTFNVDIVSPVSAVRMFKAGVIDSHNLVPKLIPQIITRITLSGDDATGHFKRTEFTNLIPFKYTLDRIEVLDEENFVFKYWLVEGGRKGKMYSAAEYQLKVEAASDGGCKLKVDASYHAYEDVNVTEDDMKVGKNGLTAMYKAVEAYLLANPTAYA